MNHQVKELDAKVDFILIPSSPISFDGTIFKPSHFPTPDNAYEPGVYWQTLRLNSRVYGLKFVNGGTTYQPKISISVYYSSEDSAPPDTDEIAKEMTYRFDLDCNIQDFLSQVGQDPVLQPAIKRWGGMRVSTPYSLYEFLVVTTVLQNTVVRRSVQMMQNLLQTFGTKVRFDDRELFAFWEPRRINDVSEEELRGLKVGYRAKIFKRQAAFFDPQAAEVKSWRLLDKELLRQRLLTIYGVGPATVQYLMFEVFHKYDAFDHIPPWEQKIYSRLLFDQKLVEGPTILDEVKRRWGRWCMLAAHYLFEDLFWRRKNESVAWLDELIRL